jgi:phosphatidylserine/phosphatidylglycerophosphate/cardiolipin synthase-like enzyme
VAAAILTISEGSLRAEISKRVAHHQHRDLTLAFVNRWRNEAKEIDARTVAVALQSAALSEQTHRDAQSAELVWTGPDTEQTPFRRTEQAILQVLDSATQRITLVSYAVYRIPRICDALIRAAHRGVRINVIVETPNKIEGQNEYDTILALGDQVGAVSTVCYWPQENRIQENGGKQGILHVKCAVADGRWLFLSSANLTEYAFTINMELGLLVTGGPLPGQVEEQFDRLIGMGVLERV